MRCLFVLVIVAFPACALSASGLHRLRYATTWLGNSFGGGPKWVQNSAESLCVLPDGTCIVGSFWDEAGREVGLYKDGRPVGYLQDTHMRGGKAIAANEQYVFYAHTCAREDQPQVKAGDAPHDKPICFFGVSRWTLDGKVAPFAGGKTHLKNMVVFREALDNHDLIPRGLAIAGNLLYVADTVANRVRVLNANTMEPQRDFGVQQPQRLAVDAKGNLWVIQTGGQHILSYTPVGKRRAIDVPLSRGSVATSLGFDPRGRLMVTDNGPRQQLLFFDVEHSPAQMVDTFGEQGGMYGPSQPGRCSPLRLAGPTGAGFDAAGNLYIACNLPRGGTVLRAFSPKHRLRWQLLGLEFVDVADARPGSDGCDVFTATNRYRFDPTAPAGKGWHWVAHTLDPIHYRDDLRLHVSVLQCATSVRVLEGQTFLCQRGMWQGVLGFYRIEGDVAIPSAVLSAGPIREDKTHWAPAGQPMGRWFWRDTNGNGRFDAGEYTPTEGPTGEYWASKVDSHGDIWQAGRDSGIWRWRFVGLDRHKNPVHDPKPDHWPIPAPFTDLLRTEYDPAHDVMYLTGQTKERPISGGEWGTAGTVVVRYDDWTKQPKLRYRVDLPYKADKTFMASLHVAGDLFFAVDCKTAQVYVYDNRSGAFLGTMRPGPEVSGESGWVDFRDALRATRLKNGNYLVFVEEDWKAKTIVYRLQDPLAQGSQKKHASVASPSTRRFGYELLVATFRTGDTEIFIVDPDTGDARNLTRSPHSKERYPAWSPDGKWVSFNSDRDGTHNLYVIGADGKNLRQLTHEKRGVEAGMQSWTADGKWIYFGLFGGGPPRMCRIAPDGTGFRVIGHGVDPAVSADGRRIAFAEVRRDGHHLCIMDADGSNKRTLTPKGNAFAGVHASWSPDGKWIVYGDQVGDALEIFRIDPDTERALQLTRLGKACTTPAVSPDGKWISFRYCDEIYWRDSAASERAYRERRADKRPVWVMGFDGSDPHVIEPLHYQTTIDGSRAPWRPGHALH